MKQYLSTSVSTRTPSLKSTLQDAVKINEDVLFYWAIISGNWGVEESKFFSHGCRTVDHNSWVWIYEFMDEKV